ncbi:MAG: metal ABC transporter permease [Geminicoccaceae bacterium]
MSPFDLLVEPFASYDFMRRALVACLALAMGCGPVGVILLLRRMSLMGDALSHAVLPGVALGFVVAGLSLTAMSLGGFIAGLVVALLAGLVSRVTPLREDASFAAFYLTSLALGVLIVSLQGSDIDLLHLLFGSVLAIDDRVLLLEGAIASVTLLTLAVFYRPLVAECFDPLYLRAVGGGGGLYHGVFLVLVVSNLVASFQALGTLMALGLMMLPAAAARFWAREVWSLALTASAVGFAAGPIGLLASYHAGLPSGPAIVLSASALYLLSVLFGPHGGIFGRAFRLGLKPRASGG